MDFSRLLSLPVIEVLGAAERSCAEFVSLKKISASMSESEKVLVATLTQIKCRINVDMCSHRKVPHLFFHLVNWSSGLGSAYAGVVHHAAQSGQD